jgi:hypothetical protein
VRRGKGGTVQVSFTDLRDSGAAIQCKTGHLQYSGNLNMDFALPGDSDRIQVTVELVWQNKDGAAGIRFLDMASHARRRLAQWIKDELAEKDARAAAARA